MKTFSETAWMSYATSRASRRSPVIRRRLEVATVQAWAFPLELRGQQMLDSASFAAKKTHCTAHDLPAKRAALCHSICLIHVPSPNPTQGAFVFSCTPCHFLISSPRTLLTNRCCLITGKPLNCSETMSRAYIEPQPPEMSWTCRASSVRIQRSCCHTLTSSFVGCNSPLMVSKIFRSFSSK